MGKHLRNLLLFCRGQSGVNKHCQSIKSSGRSSINDHANNTGRKAFIGDFSIMSKTNNSFDLLIYECLLIHRDWPSLKFHQSSIPMSLFQVSPRFTLTCFFLCSNFYNFSHLRITFYRFREMQSISKTLAEEISSG